MFDGINSVITIEVLKVIIKNRQGLDITSYHYLTLDDWIKEQKIKGE